MAEATQVALDDSENRRQARSLAQGAGHTIKDQGRRDVTLRTTCGQVIVRATYFSRNCDRSKASKGMYPMLLLWARRTLHGGHRLGDQQAGGDAEFVGRGRAGAVRPWATAGLQDHSDDRLSFRHACPGRPACGGLELGRDRRGPSRGRLHRWRPDSDSHDQARSQDGQGTQPLSHGLREPKLLIIYVVDEKGQMDREFLAVIDGTLGGPDAIFKLLEFYLRELKISTAEKILFVADGARWIWNRVGALLRRLGVKRTRSTSWWTSIMRWSIWARSRPCSTAGRRRSVRRDRSPAATLLKGGAEEVRAAIDAVCGSRPGKALKREREYFKRNGGRGRMDDARIAALKSPIGSGAIESAIRRVVNLRLKGPSIYWQKTMRRPFCCYVRTTRRDAGIILRGRHLRLQQGSPREPKEMDRSPRRSRGLWSIRRPWHLPAA